ncbi:MAG: phosphate ABC transporter permease subunit PstC [Planctomycetota bacterium]|nr:phosphate ABC transporter permease subunit PstC [Planctomycetota bacterium]
MMSEARQEFRDSPRIYGPFGLFRNPKLESLSATRLAAYFFSILVLIAASSLILYLLYGSSRAFKEIGFWNLLTETEWSWNPNLDAEDHVFGVASMLYGTLITSLIALVLAAPLSVLTATFISEYLQSRTRSILKQFLELLAAVPSVVYGLLGIVLLRPFIHTGLPFLGAQTGDTLLTGAILLAVMILPTIMTLSEDALQGIPRQNRDAALALGLTRREVIWSVVWPGARPGMISAVLLGLGRALGETIAVYLVVGRSDSRFPDPITDLTAIVSPGQTLTTKLGGPELPLSFAGELHWSALHAVALVLLLTVLLFMALGLLIRGQES